MFKKLFLTAAILLSLPLTSRAQWSVGLLGGADCNMHSQDNHYMTDYRFRGSAGMNFGLSGQYAFNDWLAVRADLTFTQKNYQFTRNLVKEVDHHYLNNYLLLPVMASFRFGEGRVHGFANAGVYGGYWLSCSRHGKDWGSVSGQVFEFAENLPFNTERDNRLAAGLVGGLGIEYSISPNWAAQIEARGYYSPVSQVKQYMRIHDYRYDTTLVLQAAVYYRF